METPTPPQPSNSRSAGRPSKLPRRFAALGLAGGLVLGGAGAVMIPAVASAASSATSFTGSGGSWVHDALASLVANGTITQAQADSVTSALDAARPVRPLGPRGGPGGAGLDAAAGAIGISGDALRTALQGGQTIAGVANAAGVDTQTVIDAIVTAENTALDQAVTDGRLTQAQADARKAQATERATALVNGVRPAHPEPPAGAPAN